jgi:hypothetical protein
MIVVLLKGEQDLFSEIIEDLFLSEPLMKLESLLKEVFAVSALLFSHSSI